RRHRAAQMLTYRDITMKLIDRSPLLQPQPLLQRQTLRHRAPLLSSRQARSLPWLISCLGVSGLVVGCGADQGSSDGTELHTGGSGGVDAGTGGMIGATGGMIGATGGTGGLATGASTAEREVTLPRAVTPAAAARTPWGATAAA